MFPKVADSRRVAAILRCLGVRLLSVSLFDFEFGLRTQFDDGGAVHAAKRRLIRLIKHQIHRQQIRITAVIQNEAHMADNKHEQMHGSADDAVLLFPTSATKTSRRDK
jgi:hypothetical protein